MRIITYTNDNHVLRAGVQSQNPFTCNSSFNLRSVFPSTLPTFCTAYSAGDAVPFTRVPTYASLDLTRRHNEVFSLACGRLGRPYETSERLAATDLRPHALACLPWTASQTLAEGNVIIVHVVVYQLNRVLLLKLILILRTILYVIYRFLVLVFPYI